MSVKSWSLSVLVIIVALLALGYFAIPAEWSNKIGRASVSFAKGHYRVTYAVDGHVRQWTFYGKVTSAPDKGYYYFWQEVDGESLYRQAPIDRTYIEELPE